MIYVNETNNKGLTEIVSFNLQGMRIENYEEEKKINQSGYYNQELAWMKKKVHVVVGPY